MAEALLGLGGNVGDVRATLETGVASLCDGHDVRLKARSSDYRTAPWGMTDQPAFINLALVVETSLAPLVLLDRALRIEAALGRDRAWEKRWGPRTIDIDIIAYDHIEIDEPRLTIPHKLLFERAFVLAPLAEIAPDHSIKGVRIADALARLGTSGIEKLPPRGV